MPGNTASGASLFDIVRTARGGETGAQLAAVWHRRIRENTAPRRRDNQGRNAPQDRAAMLTAIL